MMNLPSWALGVAVTCGLVWITTATIDTAYSDDALGWEMAQHVTPEQRKARKADPGVAAAFRIEAQEDLVCEYQEHNKTMCCKDGRGVEFDICLDYHVYAAIIGAYAKTLELEPDLPTAFPESAAIMEKIDRTNQLLDQILIELREVR